MVDFDTCPHARERNSVLADEVISDELVVKDDESDQSHIGVVDVELETLLEDWAVALIGNRSCFLFCSVEFVWLFFFKQETQIRCILGWKLSPIVFYR